MFVFSFVKLLTLVIILNGILVIEADKPINSGILSYFAVYIYALHGTHVHYFLLHLIQGVCKIILILR